MIHLSPYAKRKTIGNRTDLSILLLITHMEFGIACNHSNDNHYDSFAYLNTDSRGFPSVFLSVLQQILAAQVLFTGTNCLKHVTPLLTEIK